MLAVKDILHLETGEVKRHKKERQISCHKLDDIFNTNPTMSTPEDYGNTTLLHEKKKKKKKEKSVDEDLLHVDIVALKRHKKERQICHNLDDNFNTDPMMVTPEDNGITSLLHKTKKKKKKKKSVNEIYSLYVDTVALKRQEKERQISCHNLDDNFNTDPMMVTQEDDGNTSLLHKSKKKNVDEDSLHVDTVALKKHKKKRQIFCYNLDDNFNTKTTMVTPEDDGNTSLFHETKGKKKKKIVDEDILCVDTVVPEKHKKEKEIYHKPNGDIDPNLTMICSKNNDVITSYNLNTSRGDECTSLLQNKIKKKKKKKKKENQHTKAVTQVQKEKYSSEPQDDNTSSQTNSILNTMNEDEEHVSLLPETKKKKKKNIDEDILCVVTMAPKKHKKGKDISYHEPNDNIEPNPTMICSKNNDVITPCNLSTPEDDECTSLLPKTMKKKKKSKHDVVNKEKEIIPEKAKTNIKKTISDESLEKIVKNETAVSNEAKHNPEIVRSDISYTSEYFSTLKEQKLMTDEEQKDININSRANSSLNIFKISEERTSLLHETKKKKKKKKNVKNILYDDKVAPKILKKEKLISCHKLNDQFDSNQNVCSENRDGTTCNSNTTEDDEYTLLLKTMVKKLKKNKHTETVTEVKTLTPKIVKTLNRKKHKSDANHDKIVKNKSVVSHKEKHDPKTVRSDISGTSSKYISPLKEQKIKTHVINKDDFIDCLTSTSSEKLENILKLRKTMKKMEKNNHKNILYVGTVAPKKLKKEQLISCHKRNDQFDSYQNVCSENKDGTTCNSNITEDYEYTLLLKTMSKKLKKNKHTETVIEVKKMTPNVVKTPNRKKHKSDANHDTIVKNKNVVSHKEKHDLILVRSDISDTSPKYISPLKEQKIKTHVINKGLYVCKLCFKEFNNASVLSIHQNIHNNSVKCKDLSLIFNKQPLLLKHSGSHTMKQMLECKDCHKTFSSKNHLERHYRVHTGERPYKCNVCDKAFQHSNHVKEHNKVHTGERPYTCDICGKSCYRSSDLKKHYRIHTGERPYKCDICGKSFREPTHLKNHYRTHTGERPYKCDIFGKSFARKFTLVTHYRLHTGERPYKCALCDKSFVKNSNLTVHTQSKHNNRF